MWSGLCRLCILGVALLALAGCFRVVLPTFPHQLRVRLASHAYPVDVKFYPQDQPLVADVIAGVNYALGKSRRWGKLKTPLLVRLFPTHRSLEESVRQSYRWMRAWAMYDEVFVQSPRTWRMRFYQLPLAELLAHEVTHVVMFQLCCDQDTWKRTWIPLWFREGMASVTAHQAYRRKPWRKVRQFLSKPKHRRVLVAPERFLYNRQPMIYSISHWMFVVFLERWKDRGVRELLGRIRKGASYASAFQSVTGMTQKQFRSYFLERLRKKPPQTLQKLPSLPKKPIRPLSMSWGEGGTSPEAANLFPHLGSLLAPASLGTPTFGLISLETKTRGLNPKKEIGK